MIKPNIIYISFSHKSFSTSYKNLLCFSFIFSILEGLNQDLTILPAYSYAFILINYLLYVIKPSINSLIISASANDK